MSARTRFAGVLGAAAVAAAAFAPAAQAEPAVAITVPGPGQELVRFDTTMPAMATQVPITGLQPKETVRGIDLRPATGQVYAYTSTSRLYTIDPATGAATFVSRPPRVGQLKHGIDFNPTVDRLRLVTDGDDNGRLNVDTGGLIRDAELVYAPGDDHEGVDPAVTASAYTNNFAGAGATVLYGLDSALDVLVTQAPPNDGRLNTIGSLGVPFQQDNGFDVSGATGIAYAALTQGPSARLYRVDLGTGAATLVGPIGDGSTRIGGLTILPAPSM